eukprot:8372152-Pyramimonas_sp.AAC.1
MMMLPSGCAGCGFITQAEGAISKGRFFLYAVDRCGGVLPWISEDDASSPPLLNTYRRTAAAG